VIGYYYQWSYEDTPTFTTAESGTFYVPIRQKYDKFEFRVQAVDNDSLVDPVPARLTFPVYNSSPRIEFRLRSNPQAPASTPNVISYTFPTRTFVWDVFDADGNETVSFIVWALDDTSSWNVISRDEKGFLPDQITLTEIEPGEHVFFAKAIDVASAESNTIMFPDPFDDAVPNHWVVKPAQGNVLLVDDFAQDQITKNTQKFYTNILSQVVPDNFSVWEIGSIFRDQEFNVQNTLPYSTIDVEATLNYFDKVIWFSHLGAPHISDAGLSITRFINKGGKIFISNGSEQYPDTTWTFTNIDTVFRLNPGGRLLAGVEVWARFGDSQIDQALTLQVGKLIGNRVSSLIPGTEPGTDAPFVMQHPDSTSVPVPYTGTPAVAVRYKPSYIQGESIYFSLPLNFCDGYNNVRDLLDYILNVEFED
jgi:hypothetical protein